MKKYLILFVMGVLACGCREKTELQKSYAFSQKAGFVRMAEGIKQMSINTMCPIMPKRMLLPIRR